MKRIVSIWRSVAFAVSIAVALGFGTVQAFAAPQAPAENQAACTNSYCRKICGDLGGNWVPQYGRCLCCG